MYICSSNIFWQKEFFTDQKITTDDFGDSISTKKSLEAVVTYSLVLLPDKYDYTCSCRDFKRRRNKECRHIIKARSLRCSWNWQWSNDLSESLESTTKSKPKCPQCGGETAEVKVETAIFEES